MFFNFKQNIFKLLTLRTDAKIYYFILLTHLKDEHISKFNIKKIAILKSFPKMITS